jgi:hypothetical protein
MQQTIAKLNELWCKTLGYHKQCDVIHGVKETYTFGKVEYTAYHFGYVYGDYTQTFNTWDSAAKWLIDKIKKQIQEECEMCIQRISGGEGMDYPAKHFESILKELEAIQPQELTEEAFYKEKYLELLNHANSLEQEKTYAGQVLDRLGIKKADEEFGLPYGVGYRIELLNEKI